jgi:hypothetical protein
MKTFFCMFNVKPTQDGPHYLKFTAGQGVVFAMAENAQAAGRQMAEHVKQEGWEIMTVAETIREITLGHCHTPELRERFESAQLHGISSAFCGAGIDESGTDFSPN